MLLLFLIFLFKQKTAYEMRISDWSSDVCSSDLGISQDVDKPNLWTSTFKNDYAYGRARTIQQRCNGLIVRSTFLPTTPKEHRNYRLASRSSWSPSRP